MRAAALVQLHCFFFVSKIDFKILKMLLLQFLRQDLLCFSFHFKTLLLHFDGTSWFLSQFIHVTETF